VLKRPSAGVKHLRESNIRGSTRHRVELQVCCTFRQFTSEFVRMDSDICAMVPYTVRCVDRDNCSEISMVLPGLHAKVRRKDEEMMGSRSKQYPYERKI
jgi:hypothetical protein